MRFRKKYKTKIILTTGDASEISQRVRCFLVRRKKYYLFLNLQTGCKIVLTTLIFLFC